MKWFAALLIVVGIASVVWAVKQNQTADLGTLPVLVIAWLGGVGAAIIGVVWIAIIAFMGS